MTNSYEQRRTYKEEEIPASSTSNGITRLEISRNKR